VSDTQASEVREVLLHQVKRIRQIARRPDLDAGNGGAVVDRRLERARELVEMTRRICRRVLEPTG